MCGIFAIILKNKKLYDKNSLLQSLNKLNNRGPDFQNHYELENNNYKYFFGHTRLSILDTSSLGHQPMFSNSKRYLIIFNGEIYNHLQLRKIINDKINLKWKSNSDTETLINFIEYFDINFVLEKISGMYSFVVYDLKENKLFIARDITGEKPLYITFNENYIGFSSDLQPFKNLSFYNTELNNDAIKNYLRLNYIPSPMTIFNYTFKAKSASLIEINLNKFNFKKFKNYEDLSKDNHITVKKWWSLKNIKKIKKNSLGRIETLNHIEKLIENSTKQQLISDVPLGIFLSGGVDSSIVLSQAIKNKTNIDTYNIGFDFKTYDESADSKKISKIFKTNHHHHICNKNDSINMIDKINDAFSEPFADTSQIPTMLVSQIASKNVKVILGGDGGDEIFGGYNRYLLANKYWKYLKFFPKPLNKIFSLNKYLPNKIIYTIFDNFLNLKNFSKNKISSYNKILNKLENIYSKKSFYESLTIEWSNNDIFNFNSEDNYNDYDSHSDKDLNFEEWMMSVDFNTYLSDDILCKVDRSSMFFSLETRSPLLNRNLIEFMYSLPFDYKLNNQITKWSSKKILEKYLPNQLIYKSKQGFGVPLSEWFKNDLKEYVFDNLSKSNCDKHNLFDYNVIRKTLDNHYNKNIDSQFKLWSLIQFNSWYNKFYK